MFHDSACREGNDVTASFSSFVWGQSSPTTASQHQPNLLKPPGTQRSVVIINKIKCILMGIFLPPLKASGNPSSDSNICALTARYYNVTCCPAGRMSARLLSLPLVYSGVIKLIWKQSMHTLILYICILIEWGYQTQTTDNNWGSNIHPS